LAHGAVGGSTTGSITEIANCAVESSVKTVSRRGAVMSDRELLELAAKAAGMSDWAYVEKWGCMSKIRHAGGFYFDKDWNPLINDGDALRLAVKLGIDLVRLNLPTGVGISAYDGKAPSAFEKYTDDPYAATRRAIVRAAAEIGKRMDSKDE